MTLPVIKRLGLPCTLEHSKIKEIVVSGVLRMPLMPGTDHNTGLFTDIR